MVNMVQSAPDRTAGKLAFTNVDGDKSDLEVT